MDPIPEQVQWFMAHMTTKIQRRCWIAEYRRRAAQLEREFPEYAGLAEALDAALRAQKFSPPDKGTSTTGAGTPS